MGWVKQNGEPHRCKPPTKIISHPLWGRVSTPDGNLNDLWRCDDCRKLWRIQSGFITTVWYPVSSWLIRFRHRKD